MNQRLTKRQVAKMTGASPRTLENWSANGWLPPVRQGGGRADDGKGVENEYDYEATTWAITLKESLRAWPKTKTPVYLWQFDYFFPNRQRERDWETCRLENGLTITNYLRKVLWNPNEPSSLALTLMTGYEGERLTPPPPKAEQIALIHIRPAHQVKNLLQDWFQAQDSYTPIHIEAENRQIIMQLLAVVNISEYYRRVCEMARTL